MTGHRRVAALIVATVAAITVAGATRGAPHDRRPEVIAATCDYFIRRLDRQPPPADPADPADFAAAIAAGENGTRPFSPAAALRNACRTSTGSTP